MTKVGVGCCGPVEERSVGVSFTIVFHLYVLDVQPDVVADLDFRIAASDFLVKMVPVVNLRECFS